MKTAILSLMLAVTLVAADSCSSWKQSRVSRREVRTERSMGQRNNNDNDVVIKRKKTVRDDNGITIKNDKTVKEDNGNVVKIKKDRTVKSNGNGTTVKVKKQKKHRKNRDKDDNGVIIDTNRS